MLLVDRETMQNIDRFAINEIKIPSLCLVERAALSVMENINLDIRHSFAIIVSCGNNGADGLALARNLLALGKNCHIYIIGNKNKASKDFIINYNACKNLTEDIYPIETIEDMNFLRNNLDRVNTIIDGIFGTGLNRPVSGIYANIIELINEKNIYTISIDLPSGFDANGENNYGSYVDSDLIVCMQILKKGLYEDNYFRDKTVVCDIGLPKKAIEKFINI
ncbi:NAD(P)H-hydrate epimerase [Anaerococcus ihuae]|uniref:NAD(P)H-hydrate epimerase n=1 Tax=Anaerococcus ihuae TaxID=2899519 RepID=UPI001F3F1BDC|nr:NAD(P)H-hydrate epimerase [Anaerococcus ihuae]